MADPAWLGPFKRATGDQDKLDRIRAFGLKKIRAAARYRWISTALCVAALAYVLVFDYLALSYGIKNEAMGKAFSKWADFLAAVSALIAALTVLFSPESPKLTRTIGQILGKVVHPADVIELHDEISKRSSAAITRAKCFAAAITFALAFVKIPLG